MTFELYDALRVAGIPEANAINVAKALHRLIEERSTWNEAHVQRRRRDGQDQGRFAAGKSGATQDFRLWLLAAKAGIVALVYLIAKWVP